MSEEITNDEKRILLRRKLKESMERIRGVPEPEYPESSFRALDALVDHITGAFGWREASRDDEGTYVILYNGQDMLTISITSAEDRDNISEHSAGAFAPREFNDND